MPSAITKDELIAALAPISAALVTLNSRVSDMDTRLTDMDTRLTDSLGDISRGLGSLEFRQLIFEAKQYNSTIGRTDELKLVLKSDGSQPNCEVPRCLEQLLVAGNESLPSGDANTWNKLKSETLLREYDPGYDTDGMDADEESSKSRIRRLKVAVALGVTRMQLNFGQMTL